jgi:hypothetical protein
MERLGCLLLAGLVPPPGTAGRAVSGGRLSRQHRPLPAGSGPARPKRSEQANRPGRSAAPAVFNTIAFANPAEILVTGSTVTGRVLSFNLAARQPHDFPERLVSSTLGVDICPR